MMGFDPVSYAMGAKSGGGGSDGGGVLVVNLDMDETYALDKTWKEIHDADFAVIKLQDDGVDISTPVLAAYTSTNNGTLYYVIAFLVSSFDDSAMTATTEPWFAFGLSENDYPAMP